MPEVAQKLVSTPLFCFQDLKLSTRDIIAVLKDTLNTTLGPLPIPNPHVIRVPSNTLDKHSIGSHVVDETPIYWKKHRLSKHDWELVDERYKELHEASLI
jgi:hypothetical protein